MRLLPAAVRSQTQVFFCEPHVYPLMLRTELSSSSSHLVPKHHGIHQVRQSQRELSDETFVLEGVVKQLVGDVKHLENQARAVLSHGCQSGQPSRGARRQPALKVLPAAAAPAAVAATASIGNPAALARRTLVGRSAGEDPAGNALDGRPWLTRGDHCGVEAVERSLEYERSRFLER